MCSVMVTGLDNQILANTIEPMNLQHFPTITLRSAAILRCC